MTKGNQVIFSTVRCMRRLDAALSKLVSNDLEKYNAVKDGGCGENWCSSFNDNELLALEAIRSLHRQIDDDKNGNIDFDESDEFLREELKYEGDYENRQKKFHQNDDNHISVRELWESWVRSEVHNWTIAQTSEWLTLFVGLPQYSQNFIDNAVNGSFLPRLAINHQQVLSSTVGIKDLIHKQKIALKAQDVVLFGSPKEHGNRTKDSILTTLLVLALIVCWFVYSRYKLSQRDLNKMIKDMESLAKAEQALMDLQKELEKARTAQQEKAVEEELFKKSLDDGIPCSEEINRLKGEVEVLRNELQRAEVELQDKCWVPPPALQHWLQFTYELELKSYNRKKQAAEKQLKQAKDACDKLKKKRSSLMGAFVSTHGRSIDDVDKAILEARTALTEITQELQERMHRWKQIEILVNCPIMNNPGLPYLETILRGIGRGLPYVGPGSVISNSQDDIDDDGASSIYCPSAVSAPATGSAVHMPIMRSKSVSSMISLRERAVSRDCSSKESSTGEEDMSTETSEMSGGRDRRVTFGIRTDHRDPISALNQQRQFNKV
ncbi:unnamed protein product [Allacma fusca]|uniref:Stromal interaction molecule 1 n=1 Tax=Allacma fusca TaxID=39272 RepID=A0A8J2KZE9_9HEXA|nr:unnamed protein product [Allacma fusca]